MADDFSLDTISARLAGHSWDDISNFVYGIPAYLGFTPEQVDQHLGRPSPEPAQDSMNAAMRVKMADDPSIAAALDSAQPGPVSPMEELPASRIASYAGAQAPATQMPSGDDTYQSPLDLNTDDMRGHYADAITAGRVRSPADFAERYAGAYWNAAGADPDHGLAVTRAASGLAAQLPTDEDFTDAAIAISHRAGAPLTPEAVHAVKANIADHWADTGQSPMDTYKATYNDTELAQSLTEPPQPADTTPWWAHDPEALSASEASTAISPALMDHFSGLIDDWSKWGEAQQAIADRLRGKPLSEQLHDPELMDQAMNAAFGFGPGATERLGPKLANVIEKMGFPKVKVVDPGAPLADAVKEIPAPEASKVPEPAPLAPAAEGAEPVEGQFAPEAQPSEKMQALARDAKPGDTFADMAKDQDAATQELAKGYDTATGVGAFLRDLLPAVMKDEGGAVTLRTPTSTVEWSRMNNAAYNEAVEKMPPEVRSRFDTLVKERGSIESTYDAGMPAGERKRVEAIRQETDQMAAEYGYSRPPPPREVLAIAPENGGLNEARAATGSGRRKPGAVSLRTPEQAADRAAYVEGRDYARETWIKNMAGNAQRDIAHYTDMLEPSYPAISRNMGTWEAELAKGPAGDPMGTPIGSMLDYVEGRSKGVQIDPNSPLKPVADSIRDVEQAVDKRLRQQAEEGIITYNGYIEDHYGHNWADPRAAHQAFGVGQLGTNAGLKERTIPTLADGIRLGLTPKIANPIESVVHDMTGKILYSHAADMIADAESTGHLRWGFAPLPGEARIEGGLGRRYRPTTMEGHGEPVLQEAHAYAPEGFARNINDMLSVGLYDRPSTASVLDKLLYAKNTTTALKLASPTFHAFVEGLGSVASGVGQAIEETSRGQFLSAFSNLGKSALVAPNIIENMVVGRRAISKYVKMADDPIINYLTKAGLQFSKPLAPEAGYSMGVNSLYTSVRRGTLLRELGQDVRAIGGPQTDSALWRLTRAPDRALQFGVKEVARFVVSPITSPFFDHAIPMLKTGAAYKRMQSFLAANPTASEAVASRYARQVAMDVDNRLGELNFDTVFWPKVTKQIASAAMISPSWAYGTYRGLAAAVGVNIEKMGFEFNPVATTSLIGTVVAYGYANAVAQYLLTGKTPFGSDTPIKDFLNARTGAVSKTGAPERMMLPSELKEVYDLAKVIEYAAGQPFAIGEGLMDYAFGKANPAFQALRTFFTGKDAIGHDVANQPGGVMKYLRDNFEPIFMSAMEDKRKGTGIPDAALFAGVREASTYVTDPDKYQSQMAGVRARSARDELARAIREQGQLETPNEDIAEMKNQLKTLNQQLRAQQPQRASQGPRNQNGPRRGGRSANTPTARPRGAPRSGNRQPRQGLGRIASRGTQGIGGGSQEIGGGAQGV